VNFNSHTDVVVAVAVALVNVATSGQAQGREYAAPEGEALHDAVNAALSGGRRWLGTMDAAGAQGLAGTATILREVFESIERGDIDAAAGIINDLLSDTSARPYLLRHDNESWHLHFHGSKGDPAQDWAAGCATALAVVVGGEYVDRLGVCSAPRCDRVYVDASRNGTRRFCSTSCQNRVKAAAFRRSRAGADPALG
jgi:predicted RNA-binding Zn ribbon-like protein